MLFRTNDGAVEDMDLSRRVLRNRTMVKEVLSDDEIEHSESEESEEAPEAISDDSSKLDDEIPVAVKVRSMRVNKKLKSKRNSHDDKKAAPKDLLLKFLQPNVSNVADRPDNGNNEGYG